MAQQTAVEWLEEKFDKWADGKVFMLSDYFEIAKQREKIQIIKSFQSGEANVMLRNFSTSEQYFDELYKSE